MQFPGQCFHGNAKRLADRRLTPVQLVFVVLASEVDRWSSHDLQAETRNTSRRAGRELLCEKGLAAAARAGELRHFRQRCKPLNCKFLGSWGLVGKVCQIEACEALGIAT